MKIVSTGILRRHPLPLIAAALLILSVSISCGPSIADLEVVDYAPVAGLDWEVSTPDEQGLDPMLVAELYYRANRRPTLYSLLVIKNGYLIAEDYFNDGSLEQKDLLQSASKSYTSALVGLALEQGCLSSVDQEMLEFFPDIADQITDARKWEITIREMLQMRAGYPWEESYPDLWEALWRGNHVPNIVHFPLVSDPGTAWHYSNLTSHWLGLIVARACGTDLKSFGQEQLFRPLGAEVGEWFQDVDGSYIGMGGIHVTARAAAKFGQLYLDDGAWDGNQILSEAWVRNSLRTYSMTDQASVVGGNFDDVGYGYQWWTARSGRHDYALAMGHGGQNIVVIDDLDMVIVTTAYPFLGQHDGQSWRQEKAITHLFADFIASLPSE